jgi:hypothetical protein
MIALVKSMKNAPTNGTTRKALFRASTEIKSPGLPGLYAGSPMARDGIEPPTRGFSVRCSTN